MSTDGLYLYYHMTMADHALKFDSVVTASIDPLLYNISPLSKT